MKKILFLMTLLVMGVSFAFAQTNADIKFDKTTHDFGKFSENSPVVSCTFTFTNIGDAPLVIHQAVASCGCTVPEYTKEPIMPGKKGTIKVTYNGTGKYPGHFKINHLAYQRQNRDGKIVYRRRYDGKRCKVGKNRLLHKGESFGSPFFLFTLRTEM